MTAADEEIARHLRRVQDKMILVVNKADRNPELVNTSMQQYLAALKIVRPQDAILVEKCSALTGLGVSKLVQSYWVIYGEECVIYIELSPRYYANIVVVLQLLVHVQACNAVNYR